VSDSDNVPDDTGSGFILIFVDGQVFVYLGDKDKEALQADLKAALDGTATLEPLEVSAVRPDGFRANSVGWLTIRGDRVSSVAVTSPPTTHAHATTGYVYG
jgi:hypothetical protein